MLTWIAVIIAALALLRAWQIYSRDRNERQAKQRDLLRRLKSIEDRKSKQDDSSQVHSSDDQAKR